MNRIFFIVMLAFFACNTKDKPKEPTREERINQIAAPLIANEVGDLDILFNSARDTNATVRERRRAISELFEKFPEYLYHLHEIGPTVKNHYSKASDVLKESIAEMNDPNYSTPEVREFLDSIRLSPVAVYWVNQQKKFIEEKYRKYAEQVVYKQDLQKKYEAGN